LPDSSPPAVLSQDRLEHIRQLIRLATENQLDELALTQPDGFAVKVRTASEERAVLPAMTYSPPVLPAAQVRQIASQDLTARNPKAIALESPMVGTFYRSQTPSDPPFVKEGDTIEVGQTIGLIEAMKVYSEIPAEHAGKVIEFNAGNGQLVQFGQPLVYIEPV